MDGENLQELLQTIKDYHSPNRIVQDRARRNVKHVVHSPLYAKQLLHVLCRLDEVDEDEREFAGDLLEKHIRKHYGEYGEELKGSLKKECLIAISNPSKTVRNSAGYVIAAVVHALQGNAKEWPELMPTLQASLDSPDVVVAEGAMNTLCSLCEKSAESLLEPIAPLLPKITQCLQHPHLPLRAQAIGCVFHLALCLQCQFVLDAFDDIFQMVMESLNVEHYLIRKHISSFLVFTAATVPNNLEPLLPSVLQFMMDGLMGSDELVAMNAGEFLIHMVEENQVPMEKWLPYLQEEILAYYFKDLISSCNVVLYIFSTVTHLSLKCLIPVLLNGMVYEDKTVESLNGDKDYDSSLAESTEIEPMEEGDGEDEQEDSKDKENFELRKCCSGILDATVLAVGDEILQFFVPQVKLMLSSDDWKTVEAAVFALGAVAEGCPEVLTHFPQIVPTVISLLSHKKPLIRSISSWTLSQHVKWIASNHNNLLQSLIMDSMLKAVLDSHPHVQDTALLVFADIVETIPEFLVPYVNYILETLALVLHSCPRKCLSAAYACILALLQSVEVDYNDKKYIEVIMPPMMEKLSVLNDESSEILSFLGDHQDHQDPQDQDIQDIDDDDDDWEDIDDDDDEQENQDNQDQQDDQDILTPLSQYLSVLSGIVENLKSDAIPFLNKSDVVQNLMFCLKHKNARTQEFAFGLLGELVKNCFAVMEPLVNEWMPLVLGELHKHQDFPLTNNVIWTLAEAVLKLGVQVRPYVNDFILNLVIIANMSPTPSVMENIAYCFCNLGFVCPEVVAPRLPILGPLCFGVLPTIPDKEERETAALGLFTMIAVNPVGVEKANMLRLLYSLEFKAPLSYQLREAIHLGVTKFCAARNESFASMLEDLPNDVQGTVKTKYEFLIT